MDESRYYELVDLYKNPEHKGKLDDFDFKAEEYSSSCGDKFSVYIKMDGERIKEASFEGNGCIISTVSISKVCGAITGKTTGGVESMGLEDVKKLLGIDKISLSRIPCATIGLETIKKALNKKS